MSDEGGPAGASRPRPMPSLALVERALHAVSALAIGLTAALVVMDVALAALGRPTYVSAEIGPFLMALIVFFALPTVTRLDSHIRADFFGSLFGARARRLVAVLVGDVLFVAYAAVLFWAACDLTSGAFAADERSQGLLRTPIWIPQAGMVLGLGLLLLRTVVTLLRGLAGLRAGTPR